MIAEHEDYAYVYDLVKEMYEGSVTGVTDQLRKVIQAITELHDEDEQRPITHKLVGDRIGVHRDIARRHAFKAIKNGWLVNNEMRKHHPAKLEPGDPLPETVGLPHPDTLVEPPVPVATCHTVTPFTGNGRPILVSLNDDVLEV